MNKKHLVAVIGGGGREHAIIKSLRLNDNIEKIYALPGNGGIASDAECVNIGAKEIDKIVSFAIEKKIDFAVVAPDDPLVLGCVDALEKVGVKCFGPRANAAIIEGSKVFSKELMKKYNIPSASYEVFSNANDAYDYICSLTEYPTVIKADGLALGKGVIIAESKDEALVAVKEIMEDGKFGKSGNSIVIEQFLSGVEVSVLSFTDGKTVIPMISSMDHKRALDGDKGLNTGGMGTIAPNPFYTEEIANECMKTIFLPTINAMNKEGRPFKGCLYFGLMICGGKPYVIEYNCRFGDPEAQVVLPLLKTDLFTIMSAVADERLSDVNVEFSDKYACCVVGASGGYPLEYKKGMAVEIGDIENAVIYHAGTKLVDGKLVTNGGRVFGVTALGDTAEQARDKSYNEIKKISFDGMFYRKDIGAKKG